MSTSLRAAAHALERMAEASGVIADNFERARIAAGGSPATSRGTARGSSSGGGAGGSGGSGASAGAGGGGSAGPLASREALWWLERLWRVQTERLSLEKAAMPAGTVRRMHR